MISVVNRASNQIIVPTIILIGILGSLAGDAQQSSYPTCSNDLY